LNEEDRYKTELEDLRKSIDDVDDKILDLLNERGNLAIRIGNLKKKLNLDLKQPKREIEIVERLKNKSNIFRKEGVEAIWKEIISASNGIQGTIPKIGYLGPMGTFTHQAALEFFPKAGTQFLSFNTTQEIFENIEKDSLEFGVIPIENSLQGTVRETLDMLIERELFIHGEIELRIVQNLIGVKDSELAQINNIFSHPQAFAQTRSWLKANLPNANLIDVNSTAEAVRRVRKLDDKSYAAIGTDFAAEVYELKVLCSKIEDEPSNFTRFLIISKKENPLKTTKMKTSVVFVTKHVPGALYWVLKIFSDAEINLTKIESRPRRKGRWEYIFFMDFEGDRDDVKAKEALDKMKGNVIWYKVLGTYPIM
jgi:chorismate mutase/prephenate dehydratase